MNARRCRILVLESDEQVLAELEGLLQREEFAVTSAWDAGEALENARSRRYDVLLVGDNPPAVSASEVLRELQCLRVSIPCVVLQTGPSAFFPEYFYSLGASGVVADWRRVGEWLQERFAARRSRAAV